MYFDFFKGSRGGGKKKIVFIIATNNICIDEKTQSINLMLFLWLKNSEWKRGKSGIGE
jgi:hypothetical protein